LKLDRRKESGGGRERVSERGEIEDNDGGGDARSQNSQQRRGEKECMISINKKKFHQTSLSKKIKKKNSQATVPTSQSIKHTHERDGRHGVQGAG
jgi:hypothetical protein